MVAACGGLVPRIRLTWIDAVLMISPSKLCVLEAIELLNVKGKQCFSVKHCYINVGNTRHLNKH